MGSCWSVEVSVGLLRLWRALRTGRGRSGFSHHAGSISCTVRRHGSDRRRTWPHSCAMCNSLHNSLGVPSALPSMWTACSVRLPPGHGRQAPGACEPAQGGGGGSAARGAARTFCVGGMQYHNMRHKRGSATCWLFAARRGVEKKNVAFRCSAVTVVGIGSVWCVFCAWKSTKLPLLRPYSTLSCPFCHASVGVTQSCTSVHTHAPTCTRR
jgi:hypothetical protein